MKIPSGIALLLLSFTLPLALPVHAVDASTDSLGEYLDDAAITARVKGAIADDKSVKGRDISVRTDNGVVDLTGTVSTKDESDRATAIAAKVKSVKAVHNNLKIGAI